MMASTPTIQNVMCTVNLGCRLDLPKIARSGYNLEYNPKVFNPIVMRLHKPKSTALIFGTGKMVCTGTKDEKNARISARRFARIIQKSGYPNVKFRDYRITNISATCELTFIPHIHNISTDRIKFVDYNTDLFPGLIYRNGLTFILFKSGKVVITNGKSVQQINEGFEVFEKSINSERFTLNGSNNNGDLCR